MDAWFRGALLCATLLSVSAAPDAVAPAGALTAGAGAGPSAAGEAGCPEEPAADARTAGFDGAFRTVAPTREARVTKTRTAARPGGPSFRTKNFVAYASTQEFAREVALEAERCRQALAVRWLGKTLPDWRDPCPIRITKSGPHVGAGGATTFGFHTLKGPGGKLKPGVGGFRMSIQGSRERILDSVIPHEVNHTIFASHFKRPLPRWADEGAATLTEFTSEKMRQRRTLKRRWTSHRYRLPELLGMMEYPGDPQRPGPGDMAKVETLYAQGYSLADFLVQRGGKRAFLKLLGETAVARRTGNDLDWDYPAAKWEAALREHFDLSVRDLEKGWHGWVMAGCPTLPRDDRPAGVPSSPAAPKPGRGLPPGTLLADASVGTAGRPVRTAAAGPGESGRAAPAATRRGPVVRGQNPARGTEPVRIAAAPPPVPAAEVPAAGPKPRPAPLESFVSYDDLLNGG